MKKDISPTKVITWGFLLILAAYAVYAAVFIYQSSFVYQGERIFILFDDATISMQYARNLAHGYGPVWNAGGEHVEGYTNPLWVGFMALFHLLPVAYSKMALFIQISGAVFMMLSLVYVKKIAAFLSSNNPWVTLLAVFTTAFYYPLSNWSLLGTEVSVLLWITLLGAWLAMQSQQAGAFRMAPYLVLGVGMLVRLDMAVAYLVIWAFLVWFDTTNRRQHLLWGVVGLAVFLGGQTLLRLWYYGDPLPNTYYLKMTGMSTVLRIKRGLYVFAKFAWNLGPVFAAVPFLVFAFKRNRYVLLTMLLFLSQCAYSIYVGGDAWEHRGGANRFIALGMPFFLILFSQTSVELFGLLKAHGLKEFAGRAQRWVQPVANLCLVGFVFLSLVNFNTLLDGNSLKYWLLLQPTVFSPGSQRYVVDGLLVKNLTTPDATILVGAAGNVAYFSERFSYDMMGKADREIARQEVKIPANLESLTFLQPGHYKYDYSISIGRYQPDVLVELKRYTDEEFLPYLGNYEKVTVNNHAMYFRIGSPNVLWEELEKYRTAAAESEPVDVTP
jgi:hypothetical protein